MYNVVFQLVLRSYLKCQKNLLKSHNFNIVGTVKKKILLLLFIIINSTVIITEDALDFKRPPLTKIISAYNTYIYIYVGTSFFGSSIRV